MNKYELTNEDIYEIKTIIKVNESIREIYDRLTELEIQGKKESEEYQKEISFLKYSLQLEDSLYEKLYTSFEKLAAILKYIENEKNLHQDLDLLELLTKNDNPIFRILIKISYLVEKDDKYIENIVLREALKYLLNKEDYSELCKDEETKIILNNSLNEDYLRVYLSLIGSKLNSQFLDEEIKKELIKQVYKISFFKSPAEKMLLRTNFKIPDSVYIGIDFVGAPLMPEEDLKNYKNNCSSSLASKEIANILRHHDYELTYSTIKLEVLLRELQLRIAFQLMDEETELKVNEAFHEFIEGETYLKDHSNDKETIKIVTRAFKSIKHDKQRIMRMTLKG